MKSRVNRYELESFLRTAFGRAIRCRQSNTVDEITAHAVEESLHALGASLALGGAQAQPANTQDALQVRERHLDVGVVDALFQAPVRSRMRVLPRSLKRVVELLGSEKVASCKSLPAATRSDK